MHELILRDLTLCNLEVSPKVFRAIELSEVLVEPDLGEQLDAAAILRLKIGHGDLALLADLDHLAVFAEDCSCSFRGDVLFTYWQEIVWSPASLRRALVLTVLIKA